MAVPNFDPRTGGSCSTFMAKKLCSVVMGWVQLIFWVLGFFALVFKPSSVSTVTKNLDTTTMVMAACLILLCITFSVILLIGLHKERRVYVKAYCIFIVVYLVLLVLSFFVNLFVQPEKIGFRRFFSLVLSFLLHLFCLFIIRGYYLLTYCNANGPNQQFANQLKV